MKSSKGSRQSEIVLKPCLRYFTAILRVRCHSNGCWSQWYQFSKGREIQGSCREIKYIKFIQGSKIARAWLQVIWKDFGWIVKDDGHSQNAVQIYARRRDCYCCVCSEKTPWKIKIQKQQVVFYLLILKRLSIQYQKKLFIFLWGRRCSHSIW